MYYNDKMKVSSKSVITTTSNYNLIVLGAVAISLAASPWVNSDSLIIPKGIILISLAAYLIPKLLSNISLSRGNKALTLLILLALAFTVQMVLVMFFTQAPLEQQFFGRTGRGLGFATYTSLIIILLVSALFSLENFAPKKIINGLVIACLVSSAYSVIQRFGYDIFDWVSFTNGIIGTLGNPNFQSSFLAMALMPAFILFKDSKFKVVGTFTVVIFLLFTLYLCESTQGYIASLASLSAFILVYLWYKKKLYFFSYLFLVLVFGSVAVFGMLNNGPLKALLYKVSVQSRGEMWRTSLNTILDNPLFGVGLDSFGDVSLKYRDPKFVNGINEYTDNAHNIFLQFSITGGVLLALIYFLIVALSFYSFYVTQKKIGYFDSKIAAIFAAWLSFQLQSIISPANISMLVWNFLINGFIVGYAFRNTNGVSSTSKSKSSLQFTNPFGAIFLIIALVVVYPWYNSDKVSWAARQAGNATALVQSAGMYPESSVRYSRIGLALYESKLFNEALIVARQAVKFNPNSIQGWYLIMSIESAPIEERRKAKLEVMRLDPLNKDVPNLKL
ncbi:MAG: O-antigen ligase family protein [Actinobacteria bacterium]|nr:O-antigen ligase family protein [Actinomycetota bacterium]